MAMLSVSCSGLCYIWLTNQPPSTTSITLYRFIRAGLMQSICRYTLCWALQACAGGSLPAARAVFQLHLFPPAGQMLAGEQLPWAESEGNHVRLKGARCLRCFCSQPERSSGWSWCCWGVLAAKKKQCCPQFSSALISLKDCSISRTGSERGILMLSKM